MKDRSSRRFRYAGISGVALACSLLAAGCGAPPESTTAKPPQESANVTSSTQEVLKRHQQAFGAGDLDAMLASYSPDAVMFTPNGPVKGTDALRPVFQALFAEWGKPTTKFQMKQETVEGEFAYTFWDAETDDNIYEGGMDAFVIRDGKKVAHFFSAKITPKSVAKP